VINRIRIEQLEIRVRVGVSEQERAEPQRIVCNVTLRPQEDLDLEDDIANAVNYSKVAELIKDLATRSEFRLLETLAEKVASRLLTQFRVRKVTVEMRKFVVPDAEFVSVTATQEAAVG
jgi:7,8-dihydroneopterin aldolase/epimerase/oxygenase